MLKFTHISLLYYKLCALEVLFIDLYGYAASYVKFQNYPISISTVSMRMPNLISLALL